MVILGRDPFVMNPADRRAEVTRILARACLRFLRNAESSLAELGEAAAECRSSDGREAGRQESAA